MTHPMQYDDYTADEIKTVNIIKGFNRMQLDEYLKENKNETF